MKITVNKCPDTGELFECDRQYRSHRASFLRARRAEEKRDRELESAKRELDEIRGQLTDPANMAEWFMTNQQRLIEIYNIVERPWQSRKFYPGDRFTDIKFVLKYKDRVSNTHGCPDGGVTNWSCKEHLPRGYPGWDGRVDGKLLRSPKYMSSYPASDLLNFCKIKTGSGGGGNENWGYGAYIFLDDWPSLRPLWEDIKQTQMIKAIIESGPRASI